MYFFFKCYGDHRDLHVRTHSFPPRRSADLIMPFGCGACDQLDLPFVESEALIGRARLRLDRTVVGEQDSLRAAFDDGGGNRHVGDIGEALRREYDRDILLEIGRASWRESECKYVEIWVVGVYLKKKTNNITRTH